MERVLVSLQSADNTLRDAAEAELDAMLQRPEEALLQLVNLMGHARDTKTREMAAIIFRRCAFNGLLPEQSRWMSLSDQTIEHIKAALIATLGEEKDVSTASRVADTIAQTARNLFRTKKLWPELLQFLFHCTSSDNQILREAIWRILGALPTIFGAEQDRYEQVLHSLMIAAINDATNLRVRVAASKATVAFVMEALSSKHKKRFADVIPALLQSLVVMLQSNEEDTARAILEEMIELADTTAVMFRGYTGAVVDIGNSIIENTNADDSTRQLALEFILVLCERKPSLMRATATLADRTLRSILMLMTETDDDPEWHSADEIIQDDQDANSLVAEQGLDRFARAIRGPVLMPAADAVLAGMLEHPTWTHRQAALLAISAMAEGCNEDMEQRLPNIVPYAPRDFAMHSPFKPPVLAVLVVRVFANDPHPRVRYALCNCIGQLCYDFVPKFQRDFADQIIPCILTMLQDRGNPRVHTHAAAAIINFVTDENEEDDDSDEAYDANNNYQSRVARAFAPYSDMVLEQLLNLIGTAQKRYVLEQAVDTVAAIAEIAGSKFEAHYDTVMPTLANVLMRAQGKENRLLRGKAIECITLVGMAVGSERFREDAIKVMQVLVQTNPASLEADDPQLSYVLLAYGRVAAMLKEHFVPYLQHVMPDVLRSANLQLDVAVVDDDDDLEKYDANEGWQVLQLEDKRVCINTSSLDDKMNGMQMIMTFAHALGKHFAPYVADCFAIVQPILSRYLDEGCRVIAAGCMSPLLSCLIDAGSPPIEVGAYWKQALTAFLTAIRDEEDTEALRGYFDGFAKCVDTMGANCLAPEDLRAFTEIAHLRIEDFLMRFQERLAENEAEETDPQEVEGLQYEDENDNLMMSEMTEAVRAVFRAHGSAYLPTFSLLVPALTKLRASVPQHQRWAVCLFDDVVEFGGPQSVVLADYVLPAFQDALRSPSADVRQAAAYGVGSMAKFCGQTYVSFCVGCLPVLYSIIQHPESRDANNEYATENAISAVFKICRYHGAAFNVDEALPTLLTMLPVVADDDEAEDVYDYLCELVEQSKAAILGPSNANLPQIVHILAVAITSQVMADESATYKRCVALLRSIHLQVPPEAHAALWSKVQPAQRDAALAELNRNTAGTPA